MKRVALNKVAKIDRNAASDEQCETLPYVGLEHIEKGTGHFSSEFSASPESLRATKYQFTDKHVLYSKLRPYLNKVVLPSFDGVCTTEILPILPDENRLDRTYLWAYLLTPEFVDWANLTVSGANLPRLSPKDLANHSIPLPPIEEQRRIAEILARADRLRQMRRYALQLSDTYLQSVFLRMFGDLEMIAQKWKTKSLGSISKIPTGVQKGRRLKGRETKTVPYLRVANVQAGYLDLAEIKVIEALPSDVEKLRLLPGDILMTEGGDYDKLGRGAVWEGQIDPCIHQNHVFRVRLERQEALPKYFAQLLLTPYAKNYFLKSSKQTTNLATINKTQLRAFPVPLPPLDCQQEFVKIVEQFEKLRAQQREALRQADHLFDTLLHRAFCGAL